MLDLDRVVQHCIVGRTSNALSHGALILGSSISGSSATARLGRPQPGETC